MNSDVPSLDKRFNPIQTIRDELKGAVEAPVAAGRAARPPRPCRMRSRRARGEARPPAPHGASDRPGAAARLPPIVDPAESIAATLRQEADARAAERRCATSRTARPTSRTRMRRPDDHRSRGRGRGLARAADRSSDRAALAADQGADRLRDHVLRSASPARSTSTTSCVWPYVVAVGSAENAQLIYTHAPRIPVHPDPGRGLRRGLPRLSDHRRRRSTSSWRRASTRTSARPSCPICRDAGAVRLGAAVVYFIAMPLADAVLGRHAAARTETAPAHRSSCRRSANTCR